MGISTFPPAAAGGAEGKVLKASGQGGSFTTDVQAGVYKTIYEGTNPVTLNGKSISSTTKLVEVDTDNPTAVFPDNQANIESTNTWTTRATFSGFTINGVGFGQSQFVAVGFGGTNQLRTSPDAVIWTARVSGFGDGQIRKVTFANNLWVAVGDSSLISTSTDGITWTSRTSNFAGGTLILGLTFGGGLFVAGGSNGTVSTSSDGATWTNRTTGLVSAVGLAFGNNTYVAGGDSGGIRTSTDTITWTSRTSNFGSSFIQGIGFGNGIFVAGGQNGTVRWSNNNGVSWNSPANTTGISTNTIQQVKFINNQFYAVGFNGVVARSSDGSTWTAVSAGFGSAVVNDITEGNGLIVAVSNNLIRGIGPVPAQFLALESAGEIAELV